MKKQKTDASYYPLPVVTQEAIDEVTLRVGRDRRYSTRILLEMRDEGNIELQETLIRLSEAYPNEIDSKTVRHVTAYAYDILRERFQRNGKQIPIVSRETIDKTFQDRDNHYIVANDIFCECLHYDTTFILAVEDEIKSRAIMDIPIQHACMNAVAHLYHNIRAQARDDEFSKIEWFVAEE